jgi:hypothetical protein
MFAVGGRTFDKGNAGDDVTIALLRHDSRPTINPRATDEDMNPDRIRVIKLHQPGPMG